MSVPGRAVSVRVVGLLVWLRVYAVVRFYAVLKNPGKTNVCLKKYRPVALKCINYSG